MVDLRNKIAFDFLLFKSLHATRCNSHATMVAVYRSIGYVTTSMTVVIILMRETAVSMEI